MTMSQPPPEPTIEQGTVVVEAAVEAIDPTQTPEQARAAAALAAQEKARELHVHMTPEAAQMIANTMIATLEQRQYFKEPEPPEPPAPPPGEPAEPEPAPTRPKLADRLGFGL